MDIETLQMSNALFLIDGCNVIGKKFPVTEDYEKLLEDIKYWIMRKGQLTGKRPLVVVFFDSGAKYCWFDFPENLIIVKIQEDETSNADYLLLDYFYTVYQPNSEFNTYVVSSDEEDIISKIRGKKSVEAISSEQFRKRLAKARNYILAYEQSEKIKEELDTLRLEEKNKQIQKLIPPGDEYIIQHKNFLYCKIVSAELIQSIERYYQQYKPFGIFLKVVIDVSNEGKEPDFLSSFNTFYAQDERGNKYFPHDVDTSVQVVAERQYGLSGFYDEIFPREIKRIVILFDIPIDSLERIILKAYEVSDDTKEFLKRVWKLKY